MTKEKTTKAPKYKAILDMNGATYNGEGETVNDAITNIPLSYIEVKSKGNITIIDGDKKVERFFYLFQLRKLFANKLKRRFVAEELGKLLNG